MPEPVSATPDVAVIGAGPAGLAAAEAAAEAGARVAIYDWTPSPGRKFLMAGKSGLNLTQLGDPSAAAFAARFGDAAERLAPMLDAFGPREVIRWCEALGQPTFVGAAGRAFPTAMKASPLLRAWLARLEGVGVALHRRWRWTGWGDDGAATFDAPDGARRIAPRATVLALGGASWPRLGADAAWTPLLGDVVAPFEPSNVGWEAAWRPQFRERFAGAPIKSVALSVGATRVRGEFIVTDYGVEGGAVYMIGAALRAAASRGEPIVRLDLAPDRDATRLVHDIARQPSKASLATVLRKAGRLDPAAAGLLREAHPELASLRADPSALGAAIKNAPLRLIAPRPIAEAISSAGGVRWRALDARLMLKTRNGVFCAGEMIDWDAPTGGYLLTACFATGRWAGAAAAEHARAA